VRGDQPHGVAWYADRVPARAGTWLCKVGTGNEKREKEAKMKNVFIVVALLAAVAGGATWTTTSVSDTAVQAAVNSASNGDTIDIVSGTSTWYVGVQVTDKQLYIKGRGVDSTIIRDSVNTQYFVGVAFYFSMLKTTPCRLSNLRINIAVPCNNTEGAIKIRGSTTGSNKEECSGWRIDHIVVDSLYTGRAISATNQNGNGRFYGLIDNCQIYGRFNRTIQGVSVFGSIDSSWNQSLSLGTDSAVYIEDCTFNYAYINDGALDAYRGARYVMRNNTIYNTVIGHHGYDSDPRSVFSYEVYNNQYISNNGVNLFYFKTRGGTGVVYGNTGSGSGYNAAECQLTYYRSCVCPTCPEEDTCTDPTYTINGCDKGRCDGTNALDGNDSANGYPCRDQPGRSTNITIDSQTYAPTYAWDNTNALGTAALFVIADGFGCSNPSIADHVKENRDFFNAEMPGYTAYTYPHPLRNESQVKNKKCLITIK
jgi:hypothetical protein